MKRRRPRRARTQNAIATHVAAALGGMTVLALILWLIGAVVSKPRPRVRLDPLRTPPQRYAWTEQPEPAFPMPPYARYLAGVKIVLDPGHGGRAERTGWKCGPTGLREEEVNLRVAQFLREFLEAAGADVRMTREADVYLDPQDSVDLAKRIGLANELRADLFLSLHHNGCDQPEPNYTTLYYHAGPERSAASCCAARYILTGLDDALRLEKHLPCALLSDSVLYKNGLAVLREARVPAVLGEASFHSNPQEEQRLRDPVYNRREAYGYFIGLARWAQAGLPRVHLLQPDSSQARSAGTIVVKLDDGLSGRGGLGSQASKIAAESIVVKLDGRPTKFTLDAARSELRVEVPARLAGRTVRLFVDFENTFGQRVLHPELEWRAE